MTVAERMNADAMAALLAHVATRYEISAPDRESIGEELEVYCRLYGHKLLWLPWGIEIQQESER